MSTRMCRQLVGLGVLVMLTATTARAVQQNAAEEARLKKLDAGPKVINVGQYSAEQQKAYKLFQTKCSSCHQLSRGIGTEMVVPADWERYIKRMMYKPNSGISSDEGRTLYRFLVYDSSVRKADLLRKALAALPAADQAAAMQAIATVNPAFAR